MCLRSCALLACGRPVCAGTTAMPPFIMRAMWLHFRKQGGVHFFWHDPGRRVPLQICGAHPRKRLTKIVYPYLHLCFKTRFFLKYGCGLDRWCRCVRSCVALCVCGVLFGVLVVCCCDLCLLVCWLASRCSCVVLVFLSVFVVFCSVCLWCFAVFCVSWCAGWLGGVLVLFLWCFVFCGLLFGVLVVLLLCC